MKKNQINGNGEPPPDKGDHGSKSRKAKLSQAEVPGWTFDQALRIPRAIFDNYAGKAVTPLQLARAMNVVPTSGPFRSLCGASIAFGLTEGGYNASQIKVTGLAERIFKPQAEGEDSAARREALLSPRIIGEFLKKYDGSPLPRPDIARNVLESMGVPPDRTETTFKMIVSGAESEGLISSIKDKFFIDLSGSDLPSVSSGTSYEEDAFLGSTKPMTRELSGISTKSIAPLTIDENRRVFITHGKDKGLIEHIKRLLAFGELVPVVSVERESVSKPVPDKVLDDMRSCNAAIIHVADEMKLMDAEAKEHSIINSNVLIEIGAAMALYGRRFILLVKSGVTLPSNLQGLYEVRYEGDRLDGDTTMRLMEAIKDIKNNPSPVRGATAELAMAV